MAMKRREIKRAIELRRFGWTITDIAKELHRTPSTIKKNLPEERDVAYGGWVLQLPAEIRKQLLAPVVKKKRQRSSVPLPSNWKLICSVIKSRDKCCRRCGSIDNLGVHHIDKDRRNNILENLILLCWPCHRGVHNGKLQL